MAENKDTWAVVAQTESKSQAYRSAKQAKSRWKHVKVVREGSWYTVKYDWTQPK